jgi:hypothetical protein
VKKALVVLVGVAMVLAFCGIGLAADEPAVKEFKGVAGCFKCCFKVKNAECAPAFKINNDVILLKASEKADEATVKLIKSFAGAAEATPVVVKGVIKDRALVADEVKKVEEK